jgi:hypothetical protein
VAQQFLKSYDAVTGLFAAARPAYSDISGTPQLAQTLAHIAHKWIDSYDAATGLFTSLQPDYSDLSGTPQLAQTKTAITSQWLRSFDAITGLFTSSQPVYSDLTGLPQLAQTKASVTHQFINSYDATTGLFTAAQPAYTDVSGTPTLPANTPVVANQVLTAYDSSTGAFTQRLLVAADIPNIAESQVTNLVTDLAAKAPTSRNINTTSPITGGGDLSADRTISIVASVVDGELGIEIDGGGSAPSIGSKHYLVIPFNCTITSWTILADVSGSCAFTVKGGAYSAFPTTASIVASAKPTLTTAQKATSSTLTGWTTTLNKGAVLEFNLDSVTTCTWLMLVLAVTKT